MADVPYMSPSPSTEQLPQHTDTSASISTATPAAESTPVTQPPSTLPSDQQSTAARQRKAASTPSRKKSSASSKSKKAGAAGGSASKKAEEHPYGTAPLKVLHQGLTLWAKTKSQPWWPCEVFPPELAPEGIQRARPTGRSSNDQILVNYFGESGGFNWIKNSRAALLHFNGPWKEAFAGKKNKALAKAYQLAVEHDEQFRTEHSELVPQIEADVLEPEPVKPAPAAKSAVATPKPGKRPTAEAGGGGKKKRSKVEEDNNSVAAAAQRKRPKYSQTEVIQLLEDSHLDFTTPQIAYVIRLYQGELDVSKLMGDDDSTEDENEMEYTEEVDDTLPRAKTNGNAAEHDDADQVRVPRQFYAAEQEDSADSAADEDDAQQPDAVLSTTPPESPNAVPSAT